MRARWIWTPEWNTEKNQENCFVYFSKKLDLEKVPEHFYVKITADSRYKLYINGAFCNAGPSKGDDTVWYYDVIDAAPFLKEGENIWSVIVLHYPVDRTKGNQSVFRTHTPGLFVESLSDCKTSTWVGTDSDWLVTLAPQIHIVSENPFFAPLQIYEEVDANRELAEWMFSGYEFVNWKNAKEYADDEIAIQLRPENLKERTIPLLANKKENFKSVVQILSSAHDKEEWEQFLQDGKEIEIPEYTTECVEIDAGVLTTGYLRLLFTEGADARIEILQSECYVENAPEKPKNYDNLPVKGDRSDYKNGFLAGYTDSFTVSGTGDANHPEVYEPFWFRTFRYIRLTIQTKAVPMKLNGFYYVETGYPLVVTKQPKITEPVMKDIWEMSLRTLRRCMHETYEDCPFYEQLQYAMDSRSQILYTYSVSDDDRLARKCMDDFRRSQGEDGLLNGSYPNVGKNIIPGFSIFYIGIVYDHMQYFGDRELVQMHLPAIERILDFFHTHRTKDGLVDKIGGLNGRGPNWSFIDWTSEWDATTGVPAATLQGPITMESLLYLLGLQYAKSLYDYVGDEGKANEYQCRTEELKASVNRFCRGKNGMYQDGPGVELYSQHCQVFAILTDVIDTETGKTYLLETLEHSEDYAQCSVAMMFYLFRALEKCDTYERTKALWEPWIQMLEKHLTTCAENMLQSRSDCHAWGALALYECSPVKRI